MWGTTNGGWIFFHPPHVVVVKTMQHRLVLMAAAAALCTTLPAHAQLRLPGGGLSRLPSLPGELLRQTPLTTPDLQRTVLVPLQELRARTVRELLRDHADVIEADPAGEPVRRQELLLVSPTAATVDAALAQGFRLLREGILEGLDLRSVVLQPPPGVSTRDALARLRALDPALEVDFNHIYTRSGTVGDGTGGTAPANNGATAPRSVGLIDSGVDRRHPALQQAAVTPWGCTDPGDKAGASPHGTAVASLLVGRGPAFAGVVPGAQLFAADVYCGQPAGGSAESVAQALAWMARQRVPVVNVSLVGPGNRLLERSVQALLAKGHLVVAAVGNDGPAAPPLYPAAYPGVVGVTGVNPARRVLPEAAQGPQVGFAAPGAELAVALAGGRAYGVARGTSFAAPLVAGLLADELRAPDPGAAAQALRRLAASAVDLGAPGRDPVYGNGLVGEHARVAPERVQAQAPLP